MSVSRVCVCVLGFHRSGTSMVTRLMGQLGVDLGPSEDLLAGVEGDNPNGYFEPRWTIAINDAILATFGGSYEAPPALPRGWAHTPSSTPFARRRATGSAMRSASRHCGASRTRACR